MRQLFRDAEIFPAATPVMTGLFDCRSFLWLADEGRQKQYGLHAYFSPVQLALIRHVFDGDIRF